MLDLSRNQLTVVHARAFAAVRNLSVILLDDNDIHRVEPGAFHGLTAVNLLSLTGNRITTVVGNAFSELSGPKVCWTVNGNHHHHHHHHHSFISGSMAHSITHTQTHKV